MTRRDGLGEHSVQFFFNSEKLQTFLGILNTVSPEEHRPSPVSAECATLVLLEL